MMKTYISLLLIIWTFCSCNENDNNIFNVPMNDLELTCTPVAGGAILHYRLPDEQDVMAIRVRYLDAFKDEIILTGSYACDSLFLHGFNEAQREVSAAVTLCDRNGNESQPVEITFDTNDSAPIMFFDGLEIFPGWNGFVLTYDMKSVAKGMAHVLYVGEDPRTGEVDTLLVKSFSLSQGKDTLKFQLQQERSKNTIIVRTEDFRGYIVKQKIWENVDAYNTAKVPSSNLEFLDVEKLSMENNDNMLSKKYLFDGDTKGESSFGLGTNIFGTYLAGPKCYGKALGIIDLKEWKNIAEIRMYAILNINRYYGGIFNNTYDNKLPCDLVVYASNDKEDKDSWIVLGRFKQDRALTKEFRWSASAYSNSSQGKISDIENLRKAPPSYMSVIFPVIPEAYRYLKIIVNDTFESSAAGMTVNIDQYVSLHEIEVYTKKE